MYVSSRQRTQSQTKAMKKIIKIEKMAKLMPVPHILREDISLKMIQLNEREKKNTFNWKIDSQRPCRYYHFHFAFIFNDIRYCIVLVCALKIDILFFPIFIPLFFLLYHRRRRRRVSTFEWPWTWMDHNSEIVLKKYNSHLLDCCVFDCRMTTLTKWMVYVVRYFLTRCMRHNKI